MRNERWLAPWEPTSPHTWDERNGITAWPALHAALRASGKHGTMLPFMIVYGGRIVGQMNVSNVVHGALRSCTVGYWVDAAVAGRGITPTALALVIDHCFREVGLHRVEVDIRPENGPSLRVVEKLGLRRRATTSASSTSTAAGAITSPSPSPSRSSAAAPCWRGVPSAAGRAALAQRALRGILNL